MLALHYMVIWIRAEFNFLNFVDGWIVYVYIYRYRDTAYVCLVLITLS